MQLRLHPDLFTTSYRKYRAAIAQRTRYVVFFGAADSSKSFSAHQDLVLDLLTAQDDILVIRKQSAHIRESCYKLLKAIIRQWGLYEYFDFFYSSDKREIVYKKSGHKIVFMGCNDPESLKSLTGFYRILIEEANQLDWADFLEINRRARSSQFIQILLLLNPVSEQHWIKKNLIDGKAYQGRVTTCRVTYHDNQYITRERIVELEALKDVDFEEYRVYVLGEWGIIKPDRPYFTALKRAVHVGKTRYDPYEPVCVSIDFNYDNTLTMSQHWPGHAHYLESWHGGGDLRYLVEQVASRFGRFELRLTGDASGNSRSAYTVGNLSGWQLVWQYLDEQKVNWADEVPTRNPSTASSRFVCNALLAHHKSNLMFDEVGCKHLVTDMEQLRATASGSLDKKYAEKLDIGHYSDTGRYSMATFEADTFSSLALYNPYDKPDKQSDDDDE